MTDLESRLTSALTDYTDNLSISQDAWAQNQAELRGSRTSHAVRRFRSPLLTAAAVVAITASVAAIAIVDRPDPTATSVSTADCSLGQNMRGSLGSASASAPGSGALIVVDADSSGRSCFFDGIAWHAASGTRGRIESLGTSTAAGHSWVWVVVSASDDSGGSHKIVFLDQGGRVLPIKPEIDRSNFVDADGVRLVAAVLSGSGSVRVLDKDGKVLQERPFDTSTGSFSSGPIVAPAPLGTNPAHWPGLPLRCPAGTPDATGKQQVPGGQPVAVSLFQTGAAGEPAICMQSGATSVAIVPTSAHDSYAVTRLANGTDLLWGVVGFEATRLQIIIGLNEKTIFVNGEGSPGTTGMATLGPFRTFAIILPDGAAFGREYWDASGRNLPQGRTRS